MPTRLRALPVLLAAALALAAVAPPAGAAGRALGASWAAARKKLVIRSRALRSRATQSRARLISSRGVSHGQAVVRFPRGSTIIPAEVTVNGAATGRFVVDTGASTVSMSAAFARRLGLDLRGAREIVVHTASGPEKALRTRVARIELAGAVAEDVEVVIMKDPGGPAADGLLGLSFLSRFHMSLDAHAGVLELRAP
ncbi:MAG TPA: retropepsin-like aspartic protease [Kofleriaceae bacterium]|nr:retropepsin-like aspartic protease [Kofleriaceae bacterium]